MRRIALALVLATATRAGIAYGDAKKEAKAHLDSAKKHFDLQEYAEAEADLKAAYTLSPDPPILYALAQAQRMHDDCEHAVISYQSYLRTSPPAEQARLARDNIDRCQELAQQRKREADARAKEAERARAVSIPPPHEPGPPRPAPAPVSRPSWAGRVLVGGGALAAIAGGAVALVAQHRITAVGDAEFYDDFVARAKAADGAKTQRTIGLASAGLGVGLVVAGIVALATHDSDRGEYAAAIAVGAHGEIGVAWRW